MKHITYWTWEFGGWFQAAHPAWNGLLLTLVGLGGLALVALFYAHTLSGLPSQARWTLTAMRVALWTLILVFLANPTRVERVSIEPDSRRPLAVLLDRSGSMSVPDNRGATRLDDAMHRWAAMQSAAGELFSELRFYGFSETLYRAGGVDEARTRALTEKETHLYAALADVLRQNQGGELGGIVCLTDGLDTTDRGSDAVRAQALAARVPLYFVPSRNRVRPAPFLEIRETRVPAHVLRRTQFEWRSVLSACTPTALSVPIELRTGDTVMARATLELPAGQTVVTWSTNLAAGEPGQMPVELCVGAGQGRRYANATVQVLDKLPVAVLYYQGALDWGFPHLAGILRREPSFTLTALFHPALGVRLRGRRGAPAILNELPVDSQALAPYPVVVLANTAASQLSAAQQEALVAYVRNGGSLLFVAPDSGACNAYAGSPLEAMLPVAFEPPGQEERRDEAADRFVRQMSTLHKGSNYHEDLFARRASREVKQRPLYAFTLTPAARRLPIVTAFEAGATNSAPLFAQFARILKAKPAAEVLAVHHPAEAPDETCILLAAQTFGRGRTAVLASDSLWRWRLALAGDSHAADTFWQQLLFWLAQDSVQVLHFEQPFAPCTVGVKAAPRLVGADDRPPTVQAVSPSGRTVTLTPEPVAAEPRCWTTAWRPDAAGVWTLRARSGDQAVEARVHVAPPSPIRELSNLPPDVEGLRALAADTGGEVVLDEVPAAWRARLAAQQPLVLSERHDPLWDRGLLLALCLALYGAELILRRRQKLL